MCDKFRLGAEAFSQRSLPTHSIDPGTFNMESISGRGRCWAGHSTNNITEPVIHIFLQELTTPIDQN